jgi:hypothetical protein
MSLEVRDHAVRLRVSIIAYLCEGRNIPKFSKPPPKTWLILNLPLVESFGEISMALSRPTTGLIAFYKKLHISFSLTVTISLGKVVWAVPA